MTPGSTNQGMMGAWREAWRWRERELFIVIEDDVEMSVWWYRALANLWTRYGDRWAGTLHGWRVVWCNCS